MANVDLTEVAKDLSTALKLVHSAQALLIDNKVPARPFHIRAGMLLRKFPHLKTEKHQMSADLYLAAKRAQDLLNELVNAGFIDPEHGHFQETTETLVDLGDAIEAIDRQ